MRRTFIVKAAGELRFCGWNPAHKQLGAEQCGEAFRQVQLLL